MKPGEENKRNENPKLRDKLRDRLATRFLTDDLIQISSVQGAARSGTSLLIQRCASPTFEMFDLGLTSLNCGPVLLLAQFNILDAKVLLIVSA